MVIGIDGRALQARPWSGVGQYTYHLLHALFALDRENEYVVWYNAFGSSQRTVLTDKKGQSFGSFPTFSEYPNVHIHHTRWPNKVLNAAIKMSNVKCQMSNVDIFFMPNLNFIALAPATKLVLVVHDLSFVHFAEHFSLKSRLWHWAVNPRALLARANHVIAVSEHTKGDLVETYGIAGEKISVIYPDVDCHVAQGFSPDIRPKGLSYILFLGALEPRKNIVGIIEAYELLHRGRSDLRRNGDRISRYQLVIAGLATPYVRHLKRRITKSPLRNRIILIENPSEEQKAALYTAARLFVYPSFYEGFGFPPLEAMAHGVPVVASSASSVPEVCGDAALLVSPWKVEEIKEGMRILLENEEMRARYIEAGRARVQTFSWPQCAKEILDIFRK